MIEILLGVSVLISGFLIWYVIKLLKRFLNISEEMEALFIVLEDYSDHLNDVYKLERFYGDSTLENLMRHSKQVSEQSKIFRAMYDVDYELEEGEEYIEEEE